jgi:hypothetical protein
MAKLYKVIVSFELDAESEDDAERAANEALSAINSVVSTPVSITFSWGIQKGALAEGNS